MIAEEIPPADCDDQHRPIPGTTCCATCDAPTGWWKRAACVHAPTELFYGGSSSDRLAVRLCAACPVRPYCLEEGWDDDYGVWGGIPEGTRIRIRNTLALERVGRRQRRITVRELAARPVHIPK